MTHRSSELINVKGRSRTGIFWHSILCSFNCRALAEVREAIKLPWGGETGAKVRIPSTPVSCALLPGTLWLSAQSRWLVASQVWYPWAPGAGDAVQPLTGPVTLDNQDSVSSVKMRRSKNMWCSASNFMILFLWYSLLVFFLSVEGTYSHKPSILLLSMRVRGRWEALRENLRPLSLKTRTIQNFISFYKPWVNMMGRQDI